MIKYFNSKNVCCRSILLLIVHAINTDKYNYLLVIVIGNKALISVKYKILQPDWSTLKKVSYMIHHFVNQDNDNTFPAGTATSPRNAAHDCWEVLRAGRGYDCSFRLRQITWMVQYCRMESDKAELYSHGFLQGSPQFHATDRVCNLLVSYSDRARLNGEWVSRRCSCIG